MTLPAGQGVELYRLKNEQKNPLAERIGENVRRLRGDLAQDEVARRAAKLATTNRLARPVNQPSLSGIERGYRLPTLPTLTTIAAILEVETGQLLEGCDELLASAPPTTRAELKRAIRGENEDIHVQSQR